MTDAPVDPIHDAELALIAAGLDRAIIRRVLAQVRCRWAGDVYVRARDPEIDTEIRARLEAGEPPVQIAHRVGVHRSTITRRRSRWL